MEQNNKVLNGGWKNCQSRTLKYLAHKKIMVMKQLKIIYGGAPERKCLEGGEGKKICQIYKKI